MNTLLTTPAAIAQAAPQEFALSGAWTARGLGTLAPRLAALSAPAGSGVVVDCAGTLDWFSFSSSGDQNGMHLPESSVLSMTTIPLPIPVEP